MNLGCGEYYVPGWHNVDHDGSPHPADERLDLTGPLPWEPGTVTRAYLGHVLEHLTVADGVKLLTRLHEVTAPGGDVMVVGPDVNRAERMHAAGELDAEWLRLVKEGGRRWPGDEHRWHCEPDTLTDMLRQAGWTWVQEMPVTLVPDIWPLVDRAEWQCAVGGFA